MFINIILEFLRCSLSTINLTEKPKVFIAGGINNALIFFSFYLLLLFRFLRNVIIFLKM